MGRPDDDGASEWVNREQLDEGQAQDIAEDALRRMRDAPAGETARQTQADPAQIIADDVPDVVDRMHEMVRSGQIDNDAYSGEPAMDDEEETLGESDEAAADVFDRIADTRDDPLGEWTGESDGEDESVTDRR